MGEAWIIDACRTPRGIGQQGTATKKGARWRIAPHCFPGRCGAEPSLKG